MNLLYLAGDILLFLLHTSIVLWNLIGGFFPSLRNFHLFTLLAVLFSWIVLGYWYGWGYCFLTEWHFALREKRGIYDPYDNFLQLLFGTAGISLSSRTAKNLALGGFLFGLGTQIYFRIKKKRSS